MAIVLVGGAPIAGEASTSNTQTFVGSTSISPVSGRYYLVIVRWTKAGAIGLAGLVTHAGGLTLTKLSGTDIRGQQAADANGHKVVAFAGFASGSETAGVLTLDSEEAANMTSHQYECLELTGVHATTPIPQDDVLAENNTTDGAITFTLAGGFVNADSFTLSALGICVVDSDYTIPTGWAQLSTRGNTSPTGRLKVAYKNGNDATADWTGGDTGGTQDLAGFIVEIGAAAAGGGDALPQGLHGIEQGIGPHPAVGLGGLLQG